MLRRTIERRVPSQLIIFNTTTCVNQESNRNQSLGHVSLSFKRNRTIQAKMTKTHSNRRINRIPRRINILPLRGFNRNIYTNSRRRLNIKVLNTSVTRNISNMNSTQAISISAQSNRFKIKYNNSRDRRVPVFNINSILIRLRRESTNKCRGRLVRIMCPDCFKNNSRITIIGQIRHTTRSTSTRTHVPITTYKGPTFTVTTNPNQRKRIERTPFNFTLNSNGSFNKLNKFR